MDERRDPGSGRGPEDPGSGARRQEDPGSGARRQEDAGASRLTTTIPRPQNRRASDAGRSRLGDVRTARAAGRLGNLVPRISATWLFGLAAIVVAGAIAAALFGLPVRTWFDQDRELEALEHELNEVQDVNQDLQGEVDRLQTDEGIREAARDELGHVEAGDNRQTVLALPPLPRDLPDGWPYAQIEAILAVRAAEDVPPATNGDVTTVPTTVPASGSVIAATTVPAPTTAVLAP